MSGGRGWRWREGHRRGQHVFEIVLPSGGTNNNGTDPDNPCSYFDTDIRLTLFSGLVTLPLRAGVYSVDVAATSVDPDTGDQDDAQGTPPSLHDRSFTVIVPEPDDPRAGAAGLLALLALGARRARGAG